MWTKVQCCFSSHTENSHYNTSSTYELTNSSWIGETAEKVKGWFKNCWNFCVEGTFSFFTGSPENATYHSRIAVVCRRVAQVFVLPGAALTSLFAMIYFSQHSDLPVGYSTSALSLGTFLSLWSEITFPNNIKVFTDNLLTQYALEIYLGLTQITLNLDENSQAAYKALEGIFLPLAAYYFTQSLCIKIKESDLDENRLFPVTSKRAARNHSLQDGSLSLNQELLSTRRSRHRRLPLTPSLQGTLLNRPLRILSLFLKATGSAALLITAYRSHQSYVEIFKDLGWFGIGHSVGTFLSQKFFATWEGLLVKHHNKPTPCSLKVIRLVARFCNAAQPLVLPLPLVISHPAVIVITGVLHGGKFFERQWSFEVLTITSPDESALYTDLENQRVEVIERNQLQEMRIASPTIPRQLSLMSKTRKVINVVLATGFYAWFSAAILTNDQPADQGALLTLFGSVFAGRYIGKIADDYFTPALRYQKAINKEANAFLRTYRKIHLRAINTLYFYLHHYADWSMLAFQLINNKITIDDQSLIKDDRIKLFLSYFAYGMLGFSLGANSAYHDSTRLDKPSCSTAERSGALGHHISNAYKYLEEAIQAAKKRSI